MKNALLFVMLTSSSILGYAKESPFFLSSDEIVQEKQGSLKQLCSFAFFPLLKMEEKNANKIIELIDQELRKVGLVVEKPVLTSEGADLQSFSNPTLQFTIEQIVDQNNNPLPVLLATLSVNSVVELGKSKEFTTLNTNHWSIYLEKTNDVQKAIKKTLPPLLKQFIADFQRVNITDQMPTFYISYDSSWWSTLKSK